MDGVGKLVIFGSIRDGFGDNGKGGEDLASAEKVPGDLLCPQGRIWKVINLNMLPAPGKKRKERIADFSLFFYFLIRRI